MRITRLSAAIRDARRKEWKARAKRIAADRAKRQEAFSKAQQDRAAAGEFDDTPGCGPALGENVRRAREARAAL